ncbi:cobalamin B12-binding domain-containing protein [Methylobacterium oryzisoli]|uniref:cobalamin B12-binding domain-containing protein n=1 Tax=Methylobacterium oryzisoli TaxID=3385502 RepID=UPI0038927330
MLAHRTGRRSCVFSRPRPEPEEIAGFAARMLAAADGDPMADVQSFLDGGMTFDGLLLDLLAPTARHIGRLWEEDACDFVQVTVAMARLRQLVHDLEMLFVEPPPVDPAGRRVLLVPAPGETHTFGLTMVSHFFSEAGWDVASEVSWHQTGPFEQLRDEWFDVVGISLSCDVFLEALADVVPVIRRASCNRDLRILVGGPAFENRPDRVRRVGADAAALDARDAPGIAATLLDLRVRAC